MLPYFEIPPIQIGPLTIAPFGILVAVGIYVAARITMRIAKQDGLDPQPLADFALWGVASGVVVGHLVHLLAYHPEELSKSPFQIFKVWDGLSSFGGLLGGILAAVIFFRKRKLSFKAYGDSLALAVATGWGIARVGCFVAHDHPGVRSDFFLAVDFPGGPRHDLGLYDALLLFAIAGVLWGLRRAGKLKGKLLPLLALLYSIGRFGFDFLRASDLQYVDARYFGLTPGQYACIALFVYGVVMLASASPVQGQSTRSASGARSPSST